MSEEVIERVEQMIRKNNIKYKDQQSQKAYEQALKEYQKHSRAEMAKQYGDIVKEGNRKAIQKAKIAKKAQKNNKKKVQVPQQIEVEKPVQIVKKKISQAEVNVINKTIQARAQRIIQQKQLTKLNKKLQQQKKKTKLYELNQRCKKMLSKSHQKISSAKNISSDKMAILKKLEDKALNQIGQLDNIISDLIDKANGKKNNLQQQQVKKQSKNESNEEDIYQQYQLQDDHSFQEKLEQINNLEDQNFGLNTIIFQRSTQQLLNMDYIPI